MSALEAPTQANTSKAATAFSASQLRREAAKEALFFFFIILVFGGFIVVPILLGHLNNGLFLGAAACGGLFALLYKWKLKQANNFLAAV